MKNYKKSLPLNAKHRFVFYFAQAVCLALGVFFVLGCGKSLIDPQYVLEFPRLPEEWDMMLGSPQWKLEWTDNEGHKKSKTVSGKTEIALASTWANAVIAKPFWPKKGIEAGVFKPAGAIFPFDVSGEKLILSWQGGVEAVLYDELAAAYNQANSAAKASVPRLPQYFDWARFRQLFSDSTVNADFRSDPWLADWENIAARIVQSGFDKRRLVPEARSSKTASVNAGPWIGTSPFSRPLLFEGIPAFPVRAATDTWVSSEGILRCNAQTWNFVKFNY
ncbi:MAG: hypothetical protein FWH41_03955 [Treponema sp.]|nr:hypothetical protein [Treponema sp.]